MSILLQKSGFNFDSAQLLIKNNYYAPSIHCFYYSCLQKLLHILYHKLQKSETELILLQNNSAKGSHEIAINEVYKSFESNKSLAREFVSQMNQLKKLRVEADYKEVEILIDKSQKAKNAVIEVNDILKQIFKV